MAVTHGGLFNRLPGFIRTHAAAGLTGEATLRRPAKAYFVKHLPQSLRLHQQGDLGRADVAGFLDDFPHRQRRRRVGILDARRADAVALGVEHLIRANNAQIQRPRHGKRLEGGARLEQVGQRTVALHGRIQSLAIIGIERGQICQRQHFAGVGVQHHDAASARLEVFDGGFQLAERQILNLAVNRQRQRLAVARALDGGDVFNDMAAPVLDDMAAARLAGQHFFLGQLQPFLAATIHAGKAHHMRHHLAGRIKPAVFLLLGDAGNAQLHHRVSQLRADLPLQIQKFTALVGQLAADFAWVHFQQAGQLVDFVHRHRLHVRRTGPDGLHRGGNRQRLAVAVGDHPTIGLQLNAAAITCSPLVLQEILLDQLQINRPPQQRNKQQAQTHAHQAHARGRQAHAGAGRRGGMAGSADNGHGH